VVIYGAETDRNDVPINYFVWDPEPPQLGGGFKKIPLMGLASSGWFYVIVKDAEISESSTHTSDLGSALQILVAGAIDKYTTAKGSILSTNTNEDTYESMNQ